MLNNQTETVDSRTHSASAFCLYPTPKKPVSISHIIYTNVQKELVLLLYTAKTWKTLTQHFLNEEHE